MEWKIGCWVLSTIPSSVKVHTYICDFYIALDALNAMHTCKQDFQVRVCIINRAIREVLREYCCVCRRNRLFIIVGLRIVQNSGTPICMTYDAFTYLRTDSIISSLRPYSICVQAYAMISLPIPSMHLLSNTMFHAPSSLQIFYPASQRVVGSPKL